MSTGIQTPQSIVSTFAPFGPAFLSTRSLQKQVSLTSAQPSDHESVDSVLSPESASQWTISLLDLLAGIVNPNKDFSSVTVMETEYQQLLAVLEDLIYSVGDDENHPLSAVMTLIGVLVKTYEDQNFPKLVDLFPELAKQTQVELASEGSNSNTATFEQTEANFAIAFFSIGYLLSEAGEAEKSVCAYDLVLRLKPDSAEAYNNRGAAKKDLGQYQEAIADFDKTIRLNPNLAEPYTNRGVVMLELDQYKAAIADHDKALDLKPDYAGAYVNRGIVKSEIGKHKEAIADYDKATELDPDNTDAYYNRGTVRYALGKSKEAKSDFQIALILAKQQGRKDIKADIERDFKDLAI